MLARRTPLRRGKRLRPRGRSKYARRPRELAFLSWLHELDCAVAVQLNDYRFCRWPIEADHLGEHGMGNKASDQSCAPICSRHHRDRHERRGFFKGWSKERMREWCDSTSSEYWARWLARQGKL